MQPARHRIVALLLSGLLVASATAAEGQRKIAFTRKGNEVWVANLDGSGAKKLAQGVSPSISPDGKQVAFTHIDNKPGTFSRGITIVDVETKQLRRLSGLPSDNSHGLQWSPDGTKLLCAVFHEKKWAIGIVNPEDRDFAFVPEPKDRGFWFSPACWAADSRSIFCQNHDFIWQLALDGTVLNKWGLASRVIGAGLNSGTEMAASPDGAKLLVTIDVLAGPIAKDSPALWLLDLKTDKAERIAPSGLSATGAHWLSATEFLFVGGEKGERFPAVFRATVGGKKRQRVLPNAASPTVSR